MIPETFKKVWNIGIETSSYYLKRCDSGVSKFKVILLIGTRIT
jgi:hypothetical protein